jgi:mannitol/fructose-specific phosphotransferase system IIA component (Ntr-type)
LDAEDLHEAVLATLELLGHPRAKHDETATVLVQDADHGPDALTPGVALLHDRVSREDATLQVLVRFRKPIFVNRGEPTWFLWILLSPHDTHPHVDSAAEFAHLMEDPDFVAEVCAAPDAETLDAIYQRWRDDEVDLHRHVPAELRPSGRLFGGLRNDIERAFNWYGSDITDAANTKALASIIFLFFACLAPSVAFGGLLSVMTGGEIGVVETITATAITGVIYGLFSGQPLSLLGSTGPVTIFIGILYGLCQTLGIPYLPTLCWIGLWTSLFLFIGVAVDAAAWMRFFTRFTDDTFSALIALIFIYEAVNAISHVFLDHQVRYDTALLSLLLSVGTFLVASNLSRSRRSPYLRRPVREFLADFGPAIAIMAMTAIAAMMHEVELQTLAVPQTFGTTSGRAWLVDPFAVPGWVMIGSAVPAVLGAILLYLDQNITVRLVNSPTHRLKKGGGYHLDMLVVAGLVALFAIFGLPWTVAATVRSLNHVRSLETVETVRGQDRVVGVIENRVTNISVHALIGLSLLALPLLSQVPMSVLYGLFLFMGVGSMTGNQFFERARLWVLDPLHYPPTHYLRAVPTRVVHKYTLVQATCLGVLWAVKASAFGIFFPLFIAMLVPVRMLMGRLFKPEHLALLDAEERPDEEEFSDVG